MLFDQQRAESFRPSQKAVMPCGCVGIMLGHAGSRVQFGIEQSQCAQHDDGEVASIERNELLTPAEPFEPFAG